MDVSWNAEMHHITSNNLIPTSVPLQCAFVCLLVRFLQLKGLTGWLAYGGKNRDGYRDQMIDVPCW